MHRFAHEAADAHDLAFVPMFVRFALDRAGRKIGLADWTALAVETRRDLAGRALASDDRGFALQLDGALAHAGRPPARALAPLDITGFTSVSPLLRRNIAIAGGGLDDAAWQRLSTFDRYALVKLGDRETPSHDFAAALLELGLRTRVGGGRVAAAVQGEIVAEDEA